MDTEKPSATKRPPRPVTPKEPVKRMDAPALDPEARERQLINKAVALAERQLEDGTASAAVITHYLKLATKREWLERDILSKQSELIAAKASSITHAKDAQNLAKEAIEAMQTYRPSEH